MTSDQILLCRAKRGAFKPKPTDELLASAPRIAVRGARLEKGKIAGVLEVSFEDASRAFDVPKVHLKGAQEIAGELAATAAA